MVDAPVHDYIQSKGVELTLSTDMLFVVCLTRELGYQTTSLSCTPIPVSAVCRARGTSHAYRQAKTSCILPKQCGRGDLAIAVRTVLVNHRGRVQALGEHVLLAGHSCASLSGVSGVLPAMTSGVELTWTGTCGHEVCNSILLQCDVVLDECCVRKRDRVGDDVREVVVGSSGVQERKGV